MANLQVIEVKELMVGGLDASDVDYLVMNFTSQELRREIANAQLEAAVATAFGEDEAERYWREFSRAAQSAMEVRQWLDSGKRTKTYPGRRLDPQAIKARMDIVALVERYTTLRKGGKNFTGCCPLHDDRHPSLTVYPEQQTWHCFGCGRGGDVFTFIMEIEHTDFLGAVSILGNGHGQG